MSERVTPEELRELRARSESFATAPRVQKVQRALSAAADTIEALTAEVANGEGREAVMAANLNRRTAERDEAVALLRDGANGLIVWPEVRAFLARLDQEGEGT